MGKLRNNLLVQMIALNCLMLNDYLLRRRIQAVIIFDRGLKTEMVRLKKLDIST